MTRPSPDDAKRLLIVGCGYVGAYVARVAQEAGERVFALTRSAARGDQLRQLGIEPVVGDWMQPDSLTKLPRVDRLLVSIPHRAEERTAQSTAQSTTGQLSEEQVSQTHAVGLQNLLHALPNDWRKLVYLSTTGVYGQDSSTLVDEETPVHPTRSGPKMAVMAEQWLQEHVAADRYTVLRLAGIYGPGRIPLANKLRQREPLAVPLDGHLNLVHVRDISRMIHIVADRTMQRPCYVFSDGQPVVRETFYRRVSHLCGVPDPVFISPDPQDAKVRRATDKRINPTRLVTETHFVYQFPDYTSGLGTSL